MADVNDSTSFFSMFPTIHDYDPKWVERYQNYVKDLRALFGAHAIAAHHMGSTSVPGMKAKPIIDIKIATDLLPLPEWATQGLASLGYKHRVTPSVPSTEYSRFDRESNGVIDACLHCVGPDINSGDYVGLLVIWDHALHFQEQFG